MSDEAAASPWRPLRVPGLRLQRFLWRVLPYVGLAILLATLPRILGAAPAQLRRIHLVIVGLLLFATLRALIREVLSPEKPALRLLPIPDREARLLAAGLSFFLSVVITTEVGRLLVLDTSWNPSVAATLLVLRNVAILAAATLTVGATGLFDWLRARPGRTFWGLIGQFTGRILVPLVILALLFLVVARGLGYVPLANFVSRNLVLSGIRLIAGVVAYHYLRRGLQNSLRYFRAEPEDDAEAPALADADPTILGIERIGEAALRLLVTVFTVLWVLQAWDLGPGVVWQALQNPIVGDDGVTWARVIGGILSVVFVLALGWLVREVLTYFVFPRTNMELGARYAILAMLRYVVIALAIVFALDAIGLETSSLGWFFGAAGVGLGLGLQDVIGNFFSGLIMLVERPIRVGDTVQVGDAVGKVEDIRMRGTVIRTFDNTSVTIPNRQMLGERVTNLSYGMRHARVKIELGVDYGTEPGRVREMLLEEADLNEDVLEDPAPLVWFSSFGPSSIDFTLVCYTSKVTGRFSVASALRFSIFRRFGAEGIKIPFPQMDVHVRQGEERLDTGFRA